MNEPATHVLEIEFCVPCDFRPEAIALAKEVLDGWAHRLVALTLRPSSGGRFEVTLDGELIFSKAELGRHPEAGEVAATVAQRIGAPAQVA